MTLMTALREGALPQGMIEERIGSSTIACTGAGTSVVDDNLIGETTIDGEEGGAGETVQLNPSLTLHVLSTLCTSKLSLAKHRSRRTDPVTPVASIKN